MRLFVLLFENQKDRKVYTEYNLPKLEIKEYNVLIDQKNFFNVPVKSSMKTYDNIRKIATGQGNDCTTACFRDYNYFKNYYMIALNSVNNNTLILIQK